MKLKLKKKEVRLLIDLLSKIDGKMKDHLDIDMIDDFYLHYICSMLKEQVDKQDKV